MRLLGCLLITVPLLSACLAAGTDGAGMPGETAVLDDAPPGLEAASAATPATGGTAIAREESEHKAANAKVMLTGGNLPATRAEAACTGSPHTPGGADGAGGCWPFEDNTGARADTVLSAYAGPFRITSGTVSLDRVDATACGILAITDASVTITNSVLPVIDRTVGSGAVTVSDSDLRGGDWVGGVLWGSNITAARVEITGGQHSVHCESNCSIRNSYLHGQVAPDGVGTHNNAFISNGGSNMEVVRNTLHCSPQLNSAGGGCTANLSLFGDFARISDVVVERNLFVATPSGGYCGSFGHNPAKPFGANPAGILVTDNVFQRGANGRCGVFGPVTSFLAGNASVWANNRYDDGTMIEP